MTPLTESDRKALTLQLDGLKRRVLDELHSASGHAGSGTPATDHEVHSHADDAEAERLDDVHFAEIEVDRARLHDIELAQQRMVDGLYGICADCGEGIPRERLLAQPTAIRCAACQTEAESRHRR